MRIDAHMHLWLVARGDYGWLTPDLPIHRDYDLADAREVATGIEGVVLVQAAPTEAETHFLLEIARNSDGFVRGVVGWTDLAAGDAPKRIAALARDPLLRGLRPMLQDIADPGWILRGDVARGLDAMVKAGLALDLLIRPAHLPHCVALARRHPGLAMAIDHCAKPDIADGAFASWADVIGAVAGETRIACKLSGLVTEAAGDARLDAIAPYARHAIRAFGPDRLIWGSDWPVLTLAGDYGAWRAAAQALVRQELPEAEALVFGGNAVRFYGLGG
ncbi:amidohydrolase family protein [Acidiphilium sp. AL]|uniref:amidohydrolase family protein n=1 Tax=Acidiphilium sp. AL TaxID=2871704 RepID=UPI0021CB08F2|nr:amidohydrolase family protein [Acidiphilium sp. AL]MCU4159930.1 amidohydrolase family protein [Acidiphilium sp. AL]